MFLQEEGTDKIIYADLLLRRCLIFYQEVFNSKPLKTEENIKGYQKLPILFSVA